MTQRTVKEIEDFYSISRQQPYEQTGMIADILFLLDELDKVKTGYRCLNCGDVLSGRNYKYCNKPECKNAQRILKYRNSNIARRKKAFDNGVIPRHERVKYK